MEKINSSSKYKNQIESKDEFMKQKKENILSLRKKKINKKIFERIIKQKEKENEQKYKIYEFDKDEFNKISPLFKNKNEIYKFSIEDLNKNNFGELVKYWLYSMYNISTKGNMEKINEKLLKNLNKEKINFLIKILIEEIEYNNKNNLDNIRNQIRFKYNACSLLINILHDTNKYDEIFIDKMYDIYNFIYKLINIYQNTSEISYLVLITHYQWLINNCFQNYDSYKKIMKKHLLINFPQLIQNIFSINNPELYLNNYRMLIIYLEMQQDPKTFFQYHNFINDIQNIINYSIQINNIKLLIESFHVLKILLKSEANCKLIIENQQYIKLLTQIINGFNNILYCDCCLSRLVKNDENNLLNINYQLYKTLLDIILYKIPSKRDIIQHALKILRLIINNKNGVNLLNYIISGSNQDFLIHLQKIYFEKPYHLLIQSEVFNFLQTVFNMAKNSYKNNLLSNELHIFTLTCLEDCYQEFMTENKDNNSYIKLVIQILKLLSTILEFGNNDLNLKISLKNCCEEKNIYHILSELNYSKNGDIQDLVAYLNENFFDGYENEEYSEDYC